MTPGQAAYEAYIRAEASQLMSPKGREMAIQGRGWDVLSPAYRSYWEAAAQAAIAAQQPQGAPEVRTCYCGTTAPVVPGVFPHSECDGSVPAKTAVTPGQAARDVVAAHLQRQLPPEIPMSWSNVGAEDREVWEAAAQAAIAAQQPQGAPACRDSLHGLLGTWREYSSAHATGTHDEIVERAAIKECADELEEILDGHPEPQPAPGLGWDGLRALSD